MAKKQRILVVGAREGSLGEAVRRALAAEVGGIIEIVTAGMHNEDEMVDVRSPASVTQVIARTRPSAIVSTVGVNVGAPIGETGYWRSMRHSWDVNVEGPMRLLDTWIRMEKGFSESQQFVAISSNSAHIARRNSAAYCSSKAALSMAIRCAARELGGAPLVYGYEFGLLKGTPMTVSTEARFGPSQSRMIGATDGLDVVDAAHVITQNLLAPWHGLNGVLLRLDAGEQ